MSAAMAGITSFTAPLRDEPMSRHTSWRVGGPADLFFKPADSAQLQRFLSELPRATPLYWVGVGSNLLVRDGGIRGAVISTAGLRRLERVDATHVRGEAGVACAMLARQCVRWHLGPATFFAGIPGTLGGALAMNAGAFGAETWQRVEQVETIDRAGRARVRARSEFRIAYRSVAGPAEEWFLSATLGLEPDREVEMAAIKALMEQRGASQPLGQRSCGSVFRNPPGRFAGQLIEAAGLKGARHGGAVVSDKHANFIINTGAASAEDIETLIARVQETVKRRCGVELELEVRVVGERRGAPA